MNFRNLSVLTVCILLSGRAASGELSSLQISKDYFASLVTIVTVDENFRPISSGSGFFVSNEGHVATNHHVLAGGKRAIVKVSDRRVGEITEIVNDDPKLDLLIARTTLRNTKALTLGDSDAIRVGQKIFGLGNLRGGKATLSRGIVNGVRKAGDIELIQMTAPVSPGCSGMPVFDQTGEVIGIATAFIDLGKDFNFAMPVNYLKTLKPVRLKLAALPAMATKLEAAMRDRTVVQILLIREQEPEGIVSASGNSPEPIPSQGSPKSGFRSKKDARDINAHHLQPAPGPGTVYFKNGKRLLCDRAWKMGRTIFLVIHGKKFAVGYDENQIDMRRSFSLSS